MVSAMAEEIFGSVDEYRPNDGPRLDEECMGKLRITAGHAAGSRLSALAPPRFLIGTACGSLLAASLPALRQLPANRLSDGEPVNATFDLDRAVSRQLAGTLPRPRLIAVAIDDRRPGAAARPEQKREIGVGWLTAASISAENRYTACSLVRPAPVTDLDGHSVAPGSQLSTHTSAQASRHIPHRNLVEERGRVRSYCRRVPLRQRVGLAGLPRSEARPARPVGRSRRGARAG